jgi:hypothetical protein
MFGKKGANGKMVDYYKDDSLGCCLACSDSYDGCLCFDCNCTKCDMYDPEDHCCEYPALWAAERSRNIEVLFTTNEVGHTIIQVKTIGPVNTEDYAYFKPFLQEHFKYNHEVEAWETYSENWRFVRALLKALAAAGFEPKITIITEITRTKEIVEAVSG